MIDTAITLVHRPLWIEGLGLIGLSPVGLISLAP